MNLLKKHLRQEPADLVSLQALGTALFRMERPEEVVPILRNAWLETGDETTGLAAARILVGIRCLEQAEELLQEIADRFETPEVLNERSAVLAMLGRCEDAIPILNLADEIDTAYDRTWRSLAFCHREMGEIEEALDASERALALDVGHYRNWQIHAEVLLSLHRLPEALKAIWRGVELIDPSDEGAQWVFDRLLILEWQTIGTIAEANPPEDVVKALEEGRSRFPTRDLFPRLQANLLISRGEYEEVLSVLNKSFHAGVLRESSLELLRYETLHLLGRADEAWAAVEPFLGLPEFYHELIGASYGLLWLGETDAAEAVGRQLRAFIPDDAGIALGLGSILTGNGRYSEAEQNLLFALQASEEGSERDHVLGALGYLCLVQSDFSRADQYLSEALVSCAETPARFRVAYWHGDKVVPDFVPHPNRGLLLSRAVIANQVTLALARGSLEEAETLADQMIQEDPDDPWGYAMLGWALNGKADQRGARQAWQKALELTEDEQDKQAIAGWLESMPDDSGYWRP